MGTELLVPVWTVLLLSFSASSTSAGMLLLLLLLLLPLPVLSCCCCCCKGAVGKEIVRFVFYGNEEVVPRPPSERHSIIFDCRCVYAILRPPSEMPFKYAPTVGVHMQSYTASITLQLLVCTCNPTLRQLCSICWCAHATLH